ncbi:hypothetical protein K438DRAFT_1926718 [Mycena galopus ATCC 62051]|nr:hypothetical protein K438DRAFT_1926718 [Mycena galopus ATCC 62051]
MAFKHMKWADGFFPDMSAGTVSASGPSLIPDDQQSHPFTSPTVVSTPFTSHSSLPGHHQHAGSSSRPNLSPLFIPTPFISHLRSPATFTTPDSGYKSAFTPKSGTSFQFSPDSPSDQRGKRAYPADDLPPLYHFPEEDDDSDDEHDDDHMVVTEAERLLKLYHAGHVVAEVGVNKCWRLQCNRCSKWVNSSIPERTPLSSAGQFSGLESHQTGNKCTYSPKYRAATAPPDPQTVPKTIPADTMDVDQDELDFRNERSSSAPPADIRPPSPNIQQPFFNPAPAPAASCPGILVDWDIEAGAPGWTFPWHRVIHRGASESQTESFRIEIDSAEVTRAFSTKCTGSTDAASCLECLKIPHRIAELKDLATEAKPHTNHRYRNYQQMTTLVAEKDIELRHWRLKCTNLAKKFSRCVSKLTDYRRLAFAVAESNFPRITQFLSVGLQNGSSPRKLVNLLADVVEGTISYNPRPSTDTHTLDISTMSYVLGGWKLLYALSHGMGLPSLRTLRSHMAFTRIMPTIRTISIDDILHNIQEVVLKPRAAAEKTAVCGVNLMVDEVALEERAVHFRHTNSVGGLCWRHSPVVNLVLNTYDAALALAKSLKTGKVHFAKEMTVVAASCFGESGTYPILALPTCKHLTAADSGTIYETVMAAWRSSGAEEKVGRIWSWATDGDMIRRVAGYEAFLLQKLQSTGSSRRIYGTLAAMTGFCTLLRSTTGIALNNGRIINPTMLAKYLIRLPNQTTETVHQILFPHDPQDVPRAVDLLMGVIALGEFDYGTMDADTCSDVDALRLLAAVIKSLLEPFTNTTMSLTEQITSLATFSHLSFTLFCCSRLQYMSNQLYGDSQTMVKNAMFCLAKQQALNPTQQFYLFQVGDDPLERLFGKLRMLGGHNSAMNYLQAIDRLGHTCDLQGAFMRNPDLEQGERRLSMSRSEGVDHLTMKSWTGDLTAGSCHMPSAWAAGCEIAVTILKKTAVPAEHYNYDTLFADADVDMLRPWRGGNYPGVATDTDRSLITPTSATPLPSTPEPEPEDLEQEDQGNGISFEESIPAEVAPELELPRGPSITPEDYLNVNGKWVHKQRICRLVISKDFEPKSIVRLLRVRGFTNVNAKRRDDTTADPAVLLGADTFVVGDPILTLLRTETKVSLAVLRTTAIHQAGVSRSSILIPTIQNPAANVKLTGQILSMTLVRKTSDDNYIGPTRTSATTRADNWLESEVEESDWAWMWNGKYLKVDSVMRGTTGGDAADKVATDKVVLVSVPGVLTELVNPSMVDASIRLGEETARRINSLGQSWEIDDRQLGLVTEVLWGRATENKVAPATIVNVKSSSTFPYVFDDGTPALLSQIPTQQLTREHGEKMNRVCECCGERCDNARAHMGAHILCKMRGVPEDLKKPVGESLPCGFCGESGHAACNVHLQVKRTSATIQTNCRLAATVKYAWAERGSTATPCRNVPIICGLCPSTLTSGNPSAAQPAQWRYNMEEHLATIHPEYASPRNPDGQQRLPHTVWSSMEISEVEERALGIPQSKIPV